LKNDLLKMLEISDVVGATGLFRKKISSQEDAWDIHLSLYPVVQRVLNPPFINPHLPKMYRIYRELVPYLGKDDIPALIRLEVTEYARRPKLENIPKADLLTSAVAFSDVEAAIRDQDREKAALLMATLYQQEGRAELVRRLLLLGSGYLDQSLGHSFSCTAFILLEMLEREDQDPWPALATLADYFCKGRFHTTPAVQTTTRPPRDEALSQHMLRATSGRGIVNLHHTITLYSIDRMRRFFSTREYNHLIDAWIAFMGDKTGEELKLESIDGEPMVDYTRFYDIFSRFQAKAVVAALAPMLNTPRNRGRAGRFLIKALCDMYQGDYNPHYLTGLGSALWVADQYQDQGPVVINALYQYVDFFFSSIRSMD